MSQARQAAAEASGLLSRDFPSSLDQRRGERRVLDTRVDIDPTNAWLGDVDRRHAERRQYAEKPVPVSAFGAFA